MIYKTYLLNSLETVFYDSALSSDNLDHIEIFENEAASFQVAFLAEYGSDKPLGGNDTVEIKVETECEIKNIISVFAIDNVPAVRVGYSVSDDWFLRKTPGIYPDVLKSHPNNFFTAAVGRFKAFWININQELNNLTPGEYEIKIKLFNRREEKYIAENTVSFTVNKGKLPKQKIKTTNWMHYDCISYFSKTKPFSEKYYKVAKKYITAAAKNGQNMLLLPAFTPPLDTPVGEERQTVQLVNVALHNGKYTFDFSEMKKFIDIATECGIEYFEHCHLYTQWGAKNAPKIIVSENGKKKKLFGWHTDAHGSEYVCFLTEYLSALKRFLKENNLEERFFFHVSDEPTEQHIESYKKASDFIHKELSGFESGDALCEYKFYEQGLVHTPIPTTRVADEFIEKADNCWVYYTGLESNEYLSNRLIGMPSERARILGTQLYYLDIKGFLNWAFNAHHNRLSRKMVDPHFSSDMDMDFIAGTSYLVYPTDCGIEPSVRLMTFRDQMQDTRAYLLLESFIGRDEVCKIIKKHIPDIGLRCKVTASNILNLRKEINSLIKTHTK